MKYNIILYCSTFVLMVVFDLIWLGAIARDFYKSRMGPLLEFQVMPAIAFYVMYIAGILIFVSANKPDGRWHDIALYGALFGLFAYGTYDLTNMATLKGWSMQLVIVDMAWGIFNTALAATGGWFIAGYFRP